jgi:flagellin-like protein
MIKMGKAISPLIAVVLLIAFAITVGTIISSFLTSLTKTQTLAAEEKSMCAHGRLNIVSASCINNTIKIMVQNTGDVDLTNFTIFAKIDNNLYTNTSPLNANAVLTPGNIVLLEAYISTNGEIARLRVSAGNCPGVFGEITNYTEEITC